MPDENPFEPDETPEQQDRRIGRMIRENADKRMSVAAPLERTLEGDRAKLVIEIARELYDRFLMGGWEPQDAYHQIEVWLLAYAAAVSKASREELAVVRKDLEIADLDAEHYRIGGLQWSEISQEWETKAKAAEARISELERELADRDRQIKGLTEDALRLISEAEIRSKP